MLFPVRLLQRWWNLQDRKTLFLSDAASFLSMGVKAQAACTIYLEVCMTVRIIAMSNPLGLQCVPVRLMHDNCQGDRRAVTMLRGRWSLETNLNTCLLFPSSDIALKKVWQFSVTLCGNLLSFKNLSIKNDRLFIATESKETSASVWFINTDGLL